MNPKDTHAAAVAAMRAIVEGAKAQGRQSLTGDELAKFDQHKAAADRAAAEVKAQAESRARFDAVKGLQAPDDEVLAELFALPDLGAIKGGLSHSLSSKTPYAWKMPSLKAALTTTTLNLPATGTAVTEAPAGSGAFRIADLFPQLRTESPTVRFYSLSAATAGIVAEGALKPDAGTAATPHDVALVKIANTIKVSDELREDAEAVWAAIIAESALGVLRKENDYVVTTLTGASGVLTASGAKSDALGLLADAIAAAESLNGVSPDVILAHPLDVAELRRLPGANGAPLLDPLAAGPSTLYGVRLQPTSAVAAGKMVLTHRMAATFYSRTGLRFETAWTGDDFERNQLTGRCEERVLFAPMRPSATTVITLTA